MSDHTSTRRAYLVHELPEELMQAVRESRMDPAYDHLNQLMGCQWCKRADGGCMNTRDMEEGDLTCLDTLGQLGGGERNAAWMDSRAKELMHGTGTY